MFYFGECCGQFWADTVSQLKPPSSGKDGIVFELLDWASGRKMLCNTKYVFLNQTPSGK